MQLKNKVEREQFLENYKSWELWKEVPELELKFYRYELPNGTVIIATEYACMKIDFVDYSNGCKFKYKKDVEVNYSLLLSVDDSFKSKFSYSDNDFKLYNPDGDRKSDIIEYLTKTKPEIELCQAVD